ncbi:hypothetical protein M8J76_009115 [Diaphorina citri]|nr:hypothetical protein M8J76_009115 [Diaphorina citri]
MSPPDNSLLDVSNSSEIVEGGSAEKPSNREKVETSTCATEESVSNKNAGSKSKNKVVKDPLESYLLQLQSSHPEQNDVQKAKKPEREIILNNPEGEHTEYFETEEKSSHKAQNSDKNHATKENTNPIVGDVPIEVLEENTSKSPGDALLGNENQYQLDKIPGEPSYRMSDALLGLDSPSVTAQKPSNNTENDKSLKNQETTGSKLKNNGSLGYGNNVSKDQTGVPNTANNAYGTSQKPIQSTDNKEHKNEVYDPNNPLIENPGAIENNKNSYYGDSLRVPKNDVYGLNNLIKELPAVSPNTVDNSHGNPQQPIAPNELNNPGKGKSGLPPNTVDNSYGKPQQPLAPKETKLADNKEHTNDVNGLNNPIKEQGISPNTVDNSYGDSLRVPKNDVHVLNNPPKEQGVSPNTVDTSYGNPQKPLAPKGTKLANNNEPTNDVYGLNKPNKEQQGVPLNTVGNSYGNPQQPLAPKETKLADNKEHTNDVYGLNNPPKEQGASPNTVDNSYGNPQQPLAPKGTKLANNNEPTNDVYGLNKPNKEQQGVPLNTVGNSYGNPQQPLAPKETKLADNKEHTNDVYGLNNPPKEQGASPNTVDNSYGNPQQPLAPKGTKLANNNEPTNDVYGLNKPNKEQQGVPLNTVGNSYGNPQQPLAPKERKLADNKEHTNDVYGLNNPPKEQGVSPNTVDNSYGNPQQPLAPKGTKLANNNEPTNDVYGLNKPSKEQQGVPLNTVGNSYGNPQQPLAPKETKLADNKEHTNDVYGLNNPPKEQGVSPNTVDNSYGDSLRVPKNDVHVLNNPTKEQEVSPNTVDNSHGNPQQPLAPKGTNVVTNKEPSNDLYGLNNPTKGQPGTSNTVDNSYGNQQQLLKENSLKGTKSADNSDGNSLPRKSPNDKESQNDVHGLNNFPKSQLGELARTVNDSYGNPQQISPKGIKLPENTEPKTNVYGLNNNSKDKPSGLPNSNDNSSGDFLREKSPKDKSQVGDLPNTVDNSHGFKDFSLSSGDQKGDKKGTQLNPESARSPDGIHVKTQYVQENSVDTLGKGKLPKGPTSNESLEVKEPLLDFKEPTVKLGTSNNGNKSSNATNNDSINKYENFGNPKQQVGSKITKNGNSSSGLPSDMSGKPLIAIDYAATEPGTEGSKGWPEYGSNSIDGTSETTLEHFDNEEPPGPEVVPVGLALKQREMLRLCSLPKLPKGENICYQRKATNGTKIETWVKICDVIAKTLGFYQGLCLYIESPIDSEVYYSVCGISKADTLNTSDSSSWAFLTTQDVPIKLPKDQECHNGYKVLHEVQSSAKTNRK